MHKPLQTPWYDKSIKALQLAGMNEDTQVLYARSVRMLIEHFDGKDPRDITEDELQEYFLFRRNDCDWASSTLKICYSGLKFFFVNVLQRDWHIFEFLKARREQKLPWVLSHEEVYHILQEVKTFHNYCFLSTVYSRGLRLQEAPQLQSGPLSSI